MSGLTDLADLLRHLDPVLAAGTYGFATFPGGRVPAGLTPLGTFQEAEGLSVIADIDALAAAGLAVPADEHFRLITLRVHSSLSAVGLTAAVAAALRDRGIAANVVAARHHDHVFVPAARAAEALAALQALRGA